MSTDRQKSFTARLSFEDFSVCFLELSLEEQGISGQYSGRVNAKFGSGKGFAGFVESKWLCMNQKLSPAAADLFYFRYYDGGYYIYVREQSPNYGKCVGYSGGWLEASDKAAQFFLVRIDEYDKHLTLDDLGPGDKSQLVLKCSKGIVGRGPYKQVDHSFSYAYLGTSSDDCDLPFWFKIVERNVGYVSDPDEI